MPLSQTQYLPYSYPWGTTYHKGYLFSTENWSIHAHSVAADGQLTLVDTLNLGGYLTYLANDSNYVYVKLHSTEEVAAITFDTGTETLTKTGNNGSSINTITANSNGEIFATYDNTIKKLSFDGTSFSTSASVTVDLSGGTFGIDASTDFVIVVQHGHPGDVYVCRASDLSIIDTLTARYPDGVYIDNNICAFADDNSLDVYTVSNTSVDLIDSISQYYHSSIADNIDYDGAGNFHVYLYDSIRHIYFDGSFNLIQGDDLDLSGGGGRINWLASTYVPEVESFYITRNTTGLFVINRGSAGTNPVPEADFSATPLTGIYPLSVAFTDSSAGSPTSWLWDFGDGSTSSSQNPTHIYSSSGTYTVSLTATNTYGSDTETKTDYIIVTLPASEEDFTLEVSDINFSLPTAFVDSSDDSRMSNINTTIYINDPQIDTE